MADEDPGVGEEMLHLQPVDFRIDIDVAVHFRAAHQRRTAAGLSV
jgi:hypothetical protein